MKGLDTQGWQIQLALATYPLMKKKGPLRNVNSLTRKLNNKSNAVARIFINPVLLEKYPKGRLKHLIRQMDRFEYYLGLTQGGEHGGLAR